MSETIIPADLISPREAAKLLSTSESTIRRWCRGKLPAFKVGGRLRVSRADVMAMFRRVETPGPTIQTRAEVEQREKWIDETLKKARVRK
jgi:excisionase family DNA binding protein